MDALSAALIRALEKKVPEPPVMRKHYPEVPPDKETMDFFRKNPHISGMANGAGLNGSDPKSPRVVMVNPFSKLPPENRKLLIENERLRHFMAETGEDPAFDPTPEQTQFFKGEEYGKPENKKYLKQTIVSRIITGDPSAGNVTIAQEAEDQRIYDKFRSTFSD